MEVKTFILGMITGIAMCLLMLMIYNFLDVRVEERIIKKVKKAMEEKNESKRVSKESKERK